MVEKHYAYCAECEIVRGTDSAGIGDPELPNYCEGCGEALDEYSEEDFINHLRDAHVDWPIRFTTSIQVSMASDYSYEICEEIEAGVLPFDQDEYYIDRRLGNVDVTVKVDKDGHNTITDVTPHF